jgi:hypothetical protein
MTAGSVVEWIDGPRPAAGAGMAAPLVAAPDVPVSPEPAFHVGMPDPLRVARPTARYAAVLHPAVARFAPRVDAAVAARVPRRTPEGTANIVVVHESRTVDGIRWVRVMLPVLPNGSTGWVRRSALGAYRFVTTRLVVDLERLRATLTDHGHAVWSAPIGVGSPDYPTPRGQFYVRNVLTRYASPTYGPLAFGTSARSASLDDWPGGGFVGIHGTDAPDLIPGRISHGCVRVRNRDILRLGRLMPPGTPVVIM